MKNVFLMVGLVSAIVGASCYGSDSYKTCTDQNGNTYNVQKYGNQTTTYGTNSRTGSTWNEQASTYGNTTTINGTASNGAKWNETIQSYGNTQTISGTDANGKSFYKTCSNGNCY